MMRTGDVARDVGVSVVTIREYVRRGWLACTVTPTGKRLFREEDVIAFKNEYMVQCGKGVGENEE